MAFMHRRAEIIFGAFFGAWISVIYALISHAINQLFLPGIPLNSPAGGWANYLLEYLIMGVLLGVISTLPESRMAGVALGGVSTALLIGYRTVAPAWGFDSFGSTLIMVMLMFLPLAVLMMPLAFFVRLGADAQERDPNRPNLWPRRYLIPLILTLAAVVVGSLSLHSAQVRAAFRSMDQMVQQGLITAAGDKELPVPLRDVKGFRSEARGPYTFMWSDRVETFFGPRPAGAELSQFLIITRFENGFTFACIFSENRSTPNCTNY